ncbi:hypothetical protein [Streptomyces sp. Y1]|uniref:Serine/threonine protein kinase n=1 Tax=Streptomyces sp. Y1 TaxID=3238634 RepID=A0AB39TUJ0_9ACTN
MTGRPSEAQPWQWPPNAWQPPPVPAPPPPGAPPAAPAPSPGPRRSPRARTAWVLAAVGTGAVLAAVLATCGGPGAGDDPRLVALPSGPATPSAGPPPGPPAPSPLPAPTPEAGLGTTVEPEPSAADAQHPTGAPRPKPSHPARATASPHAAAPPGTAPTPPSLGPGNVCDQAERTARWAPGSEQARLCRSVYG